MCACMCVYGLRKPVGFLIRQGRQGGCALVFGCRFGSLAELSEGVPKEAADLWCVGATRDLAGKILERGDGTLIVIAVPLDIG